MVHRHEITKRFHSQTPWRNPEERASKGKNIFFKFKRKRVINRDSDKLPRENAITEQSSRAEI